MSTDSITTFTDVSTIHPDIAAALRGPVTRCSQCGLGGVVCTWNGQLWVLVECCHQPPPDNVGTKP